MSELYSNQLPVEYLADDVLSTLSFDVQAYFTCTACDWEWRFSPAVNLVKPTHYHGEDCPDGDGGKLSLVVHSFRQEAMCTECHQTWQVVVTALFEPIRCPTCGAASYFPLSTTFWPPFPTSFKNLSLTSTRTHVWGQDADQDTLAVHAELEGLFQWQADGYNYLVPAARFLGRLHLWNEYDEGELWRIDNLEAVLLHHFYQHTGHFDAGTAALEKAMELVKQPHPPFVLGMLEHNVAIDAYSLAARRQLQLAAFGGVGWPRQIGIDAARNALAHYARVDDSEHLHVQIARVRHVLGDLLKTGEAGERDLDEAIELLNLAIQEPAMPERLRQAARGSRATAVTLRHPETHAMWDTAEQDLLDSVETDSVQTRRPFDSLMQLALVAERRGRPDEALRYARKATELANQHVLLAKSDADVTLAADQFCSAFDILARLRVAAGQPRAALEALETVRAANLRFANLTQEDAKLRASEAVRWWVNRLAGRSTPRDGVAQRLAQRLPTPLRRAALSIVDRRTATPLVDRALAALLDASWPADTAICVFTVSNGAFSAILAYPADAGWVVQAVQWPVTEETFMRLLDVHDLDPGVFRAKRLARLCRWLGEIVIDEIVPVVRAIGAKRLAVSAPGLLSHFPYEAALSGGEALVDTLDVFYLPSVAVGAELARRNRATTETSRRVLVVAYGGDDLPRTADEVAHLRRNMPGEVDVIDGGRTTKADLLDALTQPYRIIHLTCHGTFDPLTPRKSRLYLDGDHTRDSKRISAEDLLSVRLPESPVVVLSACSSSLTSYGLMNDCAGLTGSFLQAGAQAVIGSRWAVYDDAAMSFMATMYDSISQNVSPQRAVSLAQRKLKSGHDIEDWAAFSYLGVP